MGERKGAMDNEHDATFGTRLRWFRQREGLTIEELAEKAGLSSRGIGDIERGDRQTPYRNTVELLAKALTLSDEERDELIRLRRVSITMSRVPACGREPASTATSATTTREASVSAVTPTRSFPQSLTRLIGRELVIAAVRDILVARETRLLTLTGSGGVGKTRVAVAVASTVADIFTDGAFFISLAGLADPALVMPAIAHTFGVSAGDETRLEEAVIAALRMKNALLVLDNFEQIIAAGAVVVSLLTNAPHLSVLVTSRTALHVRGERLYVIPSLGLPPMPLPPMDALSQYDAVRLFIDRAIDVDSNFVITNETAPAVAAICARLDGLPLAIELVAARARLLPPDRLLSRLDHRLRLAAGGPRDLPERQQTLRATIAWSYDLLTPGQQDLFTRLGIFVGGSTLEAMEAVCNAQEDLAYDVVDELESLLDQSLIRRTIGRDGETRYLMLETIHEYAREKLADQMAETMSRAHTAHYLTVVEQSAIYLRGPDQRLWIATIDTEQDNIRAALGWSLDHDEHVEWALRLAVAMSIYWDICSHWTEGRRWLADVLAHAAGRNDIWYTRALTRMGRLTAQQGNNAEAQAQLGEALTCARALDNPNATADALHSLGYIALASANFEQSDQCFNEALPLYRQADNTWGAAHTLDALGWAHESRAARDQSSAYYSESLAMYRAIGDQRSIAGVLNNLGESAFHRGDYTQARVLYDESLALFRLLGDRRGESLALAGQADIYRMQGRAIESLRLAADALLLLRDIGYRLGQVENIDSIGLALAIAGREIAALRLLASCTAQRHAYNLALDVFDSAAFAQSINTIRDHLDAETFETTWTAGSVLTFEDTITEALAYARDEVSISSSNTS